VFDLGITTKRAAGHGIGLALVRQTVTRLGGDIRVDGSEFEVTLPLVRSPAVEVASDD
jgi:signal transduction histidine kinase